MDIDMIVNGIYSVSNQIEKENLFSLSPSSKFILYVLLQRGPLNQREILKKTLLPKRTAAYSLKILQEKNLINKVKDNKDKRVSIFEVII